MAKEHGQIPIGVIKASRRNLEPIFASYGKRTDAPGAPKPEKDPLGLSPIQRKYFNIITAEIPPTYQDIVDTMWPGKDSDKQKTSHGNLLSKTREVISDVHLNIVRLGEWGDSRYTVVQAGQEKEIQRMYLETERANPGSFRMHLMGSRLTRDANAISARLDEQKSDNLRAAMQGDTLPAGKAEQHNNTHSEDALVDSSAEPGLPVDHRRVLDFIRTLDRNSQMSMSAISARLGIRYTELYGIVSDLNQQFPSNIQRGKSLMPNIYWQPSPPDIAKNGRNTDMQNAYGNGAKKVDGKPETLDVSSHKDGTPRPATPTSEFLPVKTVDPLPDRIADTAALALEAHSDHSTPDDAQQGTLDATPGGHEQTSLSESEEVYLETKAFTQEAAVPLPDVDTESQDVLIQKFTAGGALLPSQAKKLFIEAVKAGIVLDEKVARRLLANTSDFARDIIIKTELKAAVNVMGSNVRLVQFGPNAGIHWVGSETNEIQEEQNPLIVRSEEINEDGGTPREDPDDDSKYIDPKYGDIRIPENLAALRASFERVAELQRRRDEGWPAPRNRGNSTYGRDTNSRQQDEYLENSAEDE